MKKTKSGKQQVLILCWFISLYLVFFQNTQIVSQGIHVASPQDELYFKDIYVTKFKTTAEAEKAKAENESDLEILLNYANYYYIAAAGLPLKSKQSIEYAEKALNVYQALWKKKFSNPRIQLLVANAYLFQGTNPDINVGTLIEYVFRARNLFSMIIDRYPQNVEARLGRARINMSLNSSTGRPEAMHREDIRIYIEGYQKLPRDLQENPYFKPGLYEMYLAKALLEIETRQWKEAEKYLNLIETSNLYEHSLKMYNDAKKQLKKEGIK